ncbi:hypothetical protein N7E81_02550 [Reichenbachiella carrageenanivorans]|uniref:Uncharacterized protein n=1 Tax=Reichenbachiella carrageenanivorans TaxID=2979869 RepID=A0ABY6D804_9BACT|nr:hypothetical protein [Reichenbachiella carrageenanivorans]UXX79985.1 hypothetical protein N7E81_02550 [Reichenbachiella carrageenanivorans]
MRHFLFLLIGLGLPCLSSGQPWQLTKSVARQGIEQFALDQMGNIYVADDQGAVAKYTTEGKFLVEYAPVQVARIQEITAVSQLKVGLFYEDLQEFVFLNRYLSSPVRYRLADFGLGYIEDVAPNFQQALWVLDISDFSLKLIDTRQNRLLEQKSLAQVLSQHQAEILSFHSHQNRLYIVDRSAGVLVFDNIGNYLFQLMKEAPEEVGFDKDYIYFQQDGQLQMVHLYEGENKTVPLGDLKFLKIAYAHERLVAITPHGFNIYQYLSAR